MLFIFRQACAVESAALTNPSANVFLFYASQVGWVNKTRLPLVDALLSYYNIFLSTIHIDKNIENYVQDSPLSDWIKNRPMFKSSYIRTHMNDFLRATRFKLNFLFIKILSEQLISQILINITVSSILVELH